MRAVSNPPIEPYWRVDIFVVSKYTQGLQGHRLAISEIEMRVRLEPLLRQMERLERGENSWKELENTKIHSKNLPIRNNEKELKISHMV